MFKDKEDVFPEEWVAPLLIAKEKTEKPSSPSRFPIRVRWRAVRGHAGLGGLNAVSGIRSSRPGGGSEKQRCGFEKQNPWF